MLAGYEGASEPRLIIDEKDVTQWLYPGLEMLLQRAEAQGSFHKMTTPTPYVFVCGSTAALPIRAAAPQDDERSRTRSRVTTTVAPTGASSTSNRRRRASAIMAVFDRSTRP